MATRGFRIVIFTLFCFCASCANITAPTGGKKDKIPPKLVTIDPADSLLNTRVKRIEMDFDEYVTVSDATKEVQLSPILSVPPTVTGLNKHVIIKIVDTLLEDNTTYRLSFGNAIKDLHEGNVFKNYVYTFSTGPYFDSLQLSGNITDAATGLADTGSVYVALYSAKEPDSAVARHKPKYVTRTDNKGNFIFKGLPHRTFRIFALKDANGNLIYDGSANGEMIAFQEKTVTPGDSDVAPVNMRLFAEKVDTAATKTDTLPSVKKKKTNTDPVYATNIDTSNALHRTYDINYPVNILFRMPPSSINKDKITLSYDSSGITVVPKISIEFDTAIPRLLHIRTEWAENSLYTLKLIKGFAKDTAGKDIMPSKYTFRTQEDDDYGKITVHLPTKYNDSKYLLMVTADKDTVYQKPVTDTLVNMVRLKPGIYRFYIIIDENHNGKWDTGDLFAHKQPEVVIPYNDQLKLKAGWENIIDFEKNPEPQTSPGPKNNLPHK